MFSVKRIDEEAEKSAIIRSESPLDDHAWFLLLLLQSFYIQQ